MRQQLFVKVTDQLDAKVTDVLLATLLKNYNQCMLEFPDNVVYLKVKQVARELNILDKMSVWSSKIEESFKAENLAARAATPDMSGPLAVCLQSISSELMKLRDENAELKRMLSSIACNISSQPEIKELKEMTAELKRIVVAVSASLNAEDTTAAKRILKSPLNIPSKRMSPEKQNGTIIYTRPIVTFSVH